MSSPPSVDSEGGPDIVDRNTSTLVSSLPRIVLLQLGNITSSSAYRVARLENPSIEAISILAKTGRIPYDAVVASPRLDPVLVAKIREAILGLSTRMAEGRRVLGGPTNINGFVPADTSLYEEVRKAQKALEKN